MIRILVAFLRRGIYKDVSEQDVHRVFFLNSLFSAGFCFTCATAVMRMVQKQYVFAGIDAVGAVCIAFVIIVFHKTGKYAAIALVLSIILGCVFFFLIITRGSGEYVFVWYYCFPIISVFLLGSSKGLILSCSHFLVTAVYFFFTPSTRIETKYNSDFILTFLLSYFVLIVFAYLFQWLKERSYTLLRIKTEELSSVKLSLEQSNLAKSDFLAAMSHELRTPLNHIIGFSEIVYYEKAGKIGKIQKEHLGNVLESSRHLLSLINDLLDMSKIEAGKMELEVELIHLDEFIAQSMDMFRSNAALHNVRMSIRNPRAIKTISADKRKMKQILFNLLSNAFKFTPEGGDVFLSVDYYADGQILFCVTDTGIGIEKKDGDQVFHPFIQVSSGASRRYQGTGLGLPLTKTLVELHGGKIWLESEGLGRGSSFYFTIPKISKKVD